MRISRILARTIGIITRADNDLTRDIARFQGILDTLVKATGIYNENDKDTPYDLQAEVRIITDSIKTPGSYPFASASLQKEWKRLSGNVSFLLEPQRGDDDYNGNQDFMWGLVNDRGF